MPAAVVPKSSDEGVTVIVGVVAAFTVPVTATFLVRAKAPLTVELVMLPVMAPAVAPALMRAVIVVEATVPLFGDNVNVEWKVVPSEDTSTPAGAVIVIGAVRLLPDTV